LCVFEIPPVIRIRLDSVCLAFAVWVYQLRCNEIAVGHRMSVGEGQRVSQNCLNWAPDLQHVMVESVELFPWGRGFAIFTYINDLKSFLEKLIGFIGKVIFNTIFGGTIGLIDVNTTCWPA
jgi:hypothetical protein